MPTHVDPGLTRAQLLKVVQTGDPAKGVGKMRALAALQRPGRKDAPDVLMQVATSKRELPRFRHLAVVGLYRMGGAAADESLTAAARRADAVTAAPIAVGLGRVGTSARLRIVERLAGVAAPHAKSRVEFAATLLAYRHGLEGHDVRPPTARALQGLGDRPTQRIKIATARADAAARALAALREDPLEIELTPAGAQQLSCEPNTFLWLWAARAAQGLPAKKGVAGVLFRRRRFENAYALAAIGLATPARGGTQLTVHDAASGRIAYAGLVAADGTLELRAAALPGLAAVVIGATIAEGRVVVGTAESATVVREAKAPKPA